MSDTQKHNKPNVPNLRFPEFGEEWERKRLEECVVFLDEQRKPIKSSDRISNFGLYPYFGASGEIDRVDNYLFDDDLVLLSEDGANIIDRNYRVAFIIHGKTWVNNHAHVLKPHNNIDIDFLSESLERLNYAPYNTGTTMPKLNQEICRNIKISVPSFMEQKKIGHFLSLLNERIEIQNKVIEKYESLIKALRHRIFSSINTVNEVKISDILSYEQPTKYLVADTEYSNDNSLTPVLTANKAFILGYTDEVTGIYDKGPCIIFDDFTMDCKIVEFPFKVKSSAIKILKSKSSVNLRFIYEYLKYLDLNTEEHKRHYIAEIEPMMIEIPNSNEMEVISKIFNALDFRRVEAEKEIQLLKSEKSFYLNALFI